jgi:hypothetical protein
MYFHVAVDNSSCSVRWDLAYVRILGVENLSSKRSRLQRWLVNTLPLQRVHSLLKQRESLTLRGSIELF